MACGRWDLEIANRGFWMATLGGKVTAKQLEQMHPLRGAWRSKAAPSPEMVAMTLDKLFGG